MTTESSPWRRQVDDVAPALAKWVQDRLGAPLGSCTMPANGMANESVLFEAGGQGFVARLAPAEGSPFPTFPKFDLRFQRDCMDLVRRRTTAPVPEVIGYEEDPAWLGTPFLVMRRIDGLVPGDSPPYVVQGWMTELSAAELSTLEELTVQVLATIHTVRDPEDLALFDGAGLPDQLTGQVDYYEWAREGRQVPAIEEALDVLGATIPDDDRRVLNWGDSRIGNIIYRDARPVGILDWEMATAGPPEVDVAWMLFMHLFMQDMISAAGLPGMPEFLRRDRVVDLYQEASAETLEDLTWYLAFAGLRFAIILLRMGLRAAAYGHMDPDADPDSLIMFAPLLRRLVGELRH